MRGIADLILLLTPAFEATRYDAVCNAARRYRNPRYRPPLLVSVTSDADMATGMAFPVARVINSLHADVIPNHDRIHEPAFEYFLGQLYEDIRELPRRGSRCGAMPRP